MAFLRMRFCMRRQYKTLTAVSTAESRCRNVRHNLNIRIALMEEGRKRVLAIVAGIVVARHLKTTDDLFDSKPSPRTASIVAAAGSVGGADHEED